MTKAPNDLESHFHWNGEVFTDGQMIDTVTPRHSRSKVNNLKLRAEPVWDPAEHPKAWRAVWQYSAKRARRDTATLAAQEARARAVIDGSKPVKSTRFVTIKGDDRTLDEASLARARKLVGLKGYVTNIAADVMPAPEVISKYHDMWHVEQSFRMSKHDLQARPMLSSAPMAEMVVRSIINRRNTYRAHRRVVEALGAANLPSRPPTLGCGAAVARNGDPQNQRVAGDRQIGQRPDHGVAVAPVLATVRVARIAGHRGTEDRRLLVIDGGGSDCHAQLDGAHDRVGNNSGRAGSSLGQRVTSVVVVKLGVGTRIVTHRGPASAHRHDTFTQISAGHRCTLIHEEPFYF
jgi:hypothetical protein